MREAAECGCLRILVFTCSDLQIHPGQFAQGREVDLVVVRTPANVVHPHVTTACGSPGELESWMAGCDEVIVCGHTHCHVLECAVGSKGREGLPHAIAAALLARAGPTLQIVNDHYRSLSDEELLEMAACENVLVQLENLQRFPVMAGRLSRGEVRLQGWIYDDETGEMHTYDPDTCQFLPLASSGTQFAEPWSQFGMTAQTSMAS
jgi:carbonic anhydrase